MGNRLKYAMDKRSLGQAKSDFARGINAQQRIIKYLKDNDFDIEVLDDDEYFGKLEDYKPDIKIMGVFVEIKYTDKQCRNNHFDFKCNQTYKLAKLGGYFFCVKEIGSIGYYFTIWAKDVLKLKKISGEESYCNKECFRLEDVEWKLLQHRL